MNIREVATHWVMELQRIRYELECLENCEDGHEMIDIAQRLACDIESLEGQLDTEFDLGMDEE